jgi:hypothetical protein
MDSRCKDDGYRKRGQRAIVSLYASDNSAVSVVNMLENNVIKFCQIAY